MRVLRPHIVGAAKPIGDPSAFSDLAFGHGLFLYDFTILMEVGVSPRATSKNWCQKEAERGCQDRLEW